MTHNINKLIGRGAFVLFMFVSITSSSQGFLHRDGQKIVDGSGNNVLLRGLGIGGLMVQEGYMLKTADFAGPQYKIRQKISELVGEENTAKFYDAYKSNGLTKRDVDSLAAWGFNSIRLPMHYNLYTLPIEKEPVKGQNTWLDEGFKMTDELLGWCAANKMYLILDLHAAPGGQGKDANISDYDESKPSLWESKENQAKMIAFWSRVAERYKDSPWIGGYDIINEPNWNFSGTNQNGCDETLNEPLRDLQMRITQAIREEDKNHLVIIEGNCWGNNYKGIFPLWDDNIALSFHKYWNNNDVAAIQGIMSLRKEQNVPIWLGESGENSNVWFQQVIRLVESNNIGWAFWPMKKIDNIAGVTSVSETDGYRRLLEYWKGNKDKPSPEEAMATLMQLAENYKMENVTIKRDVIDAMFRQVNSKQTKPYKRNAIPGKIFATDYDLGQINEAYADNDFQNLWVSTGKHTEWNKGNKMRNDGVDITVCSDKITNGYCVTDIEKGEWLQFTIDAEQSSFYNITARFASKTAAGKMYLSTKTESPLTASITLPSSGGDSKWSDISLGKVLLKKGVNILRLYFEKGDFNLNYVEFKIAN